jgi:hypothetical protein
VQIFIFYLTDHPLSTYEIFNGALPWWAPATPVVGGIYILAMRWRVGVQLIGT